MKKPKKTFNIKKIFIFKKAYTLIELLVIGIIIILLSIVGYVSLTSYTIDSKNTKRLSDLNYISTYVNTKLEKGTNITSFTTNTNNSINNINLGGITLPKITNKYIAGDVNYKNLHIKNEVFKDPDGFSYVVGASSLNGGIYELAGTIELRGYKLAKVIGNYKPRVANDYTQGKVYGKFFKITDPFDSGKYKVGDVVKNNINSKLLTISKITNNGLALIFNGEIDSRITAIAIAKDESLGLIEGTNIGGYKGIVKNNGVFLPY